MSHYDCKECDASPHEDHAPSCSKNPIPEWALKEAVARLNNEGPLRSYTYPKDAKMHQVKTVARLIAKYEQPPVDPNAGALGRVLEQWNCAPNGRRWDCALAQFKTEIAAAKERG